MQFYLFTNFVLSGVVSPRSQIRDKSPIKMFCKQLYEKPMNMIYHSQIKNKSITAYKPISGNIRKSKVSLSKWFIINRVESKIKQFQNHQKETNQWVRFKS